VGSRWRTPSPSGNAITPVTVPRTFVALKCGAPSPVNEKGQTVKADAPDATAPDINEHNEPRELMEHSSSFEHSPSKPAWGLDTVALRNHRRWGSTARTAAALSVSSRRAGTPRREQRSQEQQRRGAR
jgi:hypothetical protein